MAIASNELKHVITGAILDSVNIEYVEGGGNLALLLSSSISTTFHDSLRLTVYSIETRVVMFSQLHDVI